MGYIYVFEFPNGKRYVGATTMKKTKYRWNNGKQYTVGTPVRTAIDEFGWDNIDKHWFYVPDELLDDTERSVIRWLRTTDQEYGYNMYSGGKIGFQQPEETRRKLSESKKGNNYFKGKHHTEETRRKMSEVQKGRHQSEETRRKISETMKGRQKSEDTRRKISESEKGKHQSEETRKKISESQKLRLAKKKGLI